MAHCSTCSKKLAAGNRHGQCRSCRYPRRAIRRCSMCARVISHKNQSGICVSCRCALNRAHPARIQALREAFQRPEYIETLRARSRAIAQTEAGKLQRYEAGKKPKKPVPVLTPFERAMERVRNGASISIVRPIPRSEYQFTLGGVSSI